MVSTYCGLTDVKFDYLRIRLYIFFYIIISEYETKNYPSYSLLFELSTLYHKIQPLLHYQNVFTHVHHKIINPFY